MSRKCFRQPTVKLFFFFFFSYFQLVTRGSSFVPLEYTLCTPCLGVSIAKVDQIHVKQSRYSSTVDIRQQPISVGTCSLQNTEEQNCLITQLDISFRENCRKQRYILIKY